MQDFGTYTWLNFRGSIGEYLCYELLKKNPSNFDYVYRIYRHLINVTWIWCWKNNFRCFFHTSRLECSAMFMHIFTEWNVSFTMISNLLPIIVSQFTSGGKSWGMFMMFSPLTGDNESKPEKCFHFSRNSEMFTNGWIYIGLQSFSVDFRMFHFEKWKHCRESGCRCVWTCFE